MRVLSRKELLKCTGLETDAFTSMARRYQLPLFARRVLDAEGVRYLDLDAPAIVLAGALARGLGLDLAAQVITRFPEAYLDCVDRAEESVDPIFFGVFLSDDGDPWADGGTLSELVRSADVNVAHIVLENMTRVMAVVRNFAREAGVQLPERLVLRPDDPRL